MQRRLLEARGDADTRWGSLSQYTYKPVMTYQLKSSNSRARMGNGVPVLYNSGGTLGWEGTQE